MVANEWENPNKVEEELAYGSEGGYTKLNSVETYHTKLRFDLIDPQMSLNLPSKTRYVFFTYT
jgi:hypothetical protein